MLYNSPGIAYNTPGIVYNQGPAGVRFVDEDFRTFLLTLLDGPPVEKGKISTTQPPVRVYFQRAQTNNEVLLKGPGTGGLWETWFDVEVGVLEDDATAQDIAQNLKQGISPLPGINGYLSCNSGRWGDPVTGHWIHGAFTHDQDDDYQSRLLDSDDGYYVASFRVQVWHEPA